MYIFINKPRKKLYNFNIFTEYILDYNIIKFII